MKELSLFIDESGDKSRHADYFVLVVVVHEQAKSIQREITRYEQSLATRELPNIPFHSEPLLNNHKSYADLNPSDRKSLLYSFGILTQRLPVRYSSFAYDRRKLKASASLFKALKRDLTDWLRSDLEFFQSFDRVKVYYDNGQRLVKRALMDAIQKVLSRQAIIQKRTSMSDYRLAQAADYFCTIELATLKYARGEDGETYNKFFGTRGNFKKNWLKQARRKHF